MTQPLRVGYLSAVDPLDRWAWSGCHHYMFQAQQAAGLDVVHLGRSVAPRVTLLRRALGKARRVTARWLHPADASANGLVPLLDADAWAAAITRELAQHPVDVVFGPVTSETVAATVTDRPMVFLSDTTFRLVRAHYPQFAALPAERAAALDAIERKAMQKSVRRIFSSQWAADSAIRDYGMDPATVRVIPFGANLDHVPTPEAARQKELGGPCRLLFVGKDWARKGGEIAVETCRALRALGVPAELALVGGVPPQPLVEAPGVTLLGDLNKRKRRDRHRLEALFHAAHFFLLPTRADCTPLVCGEANAYGLPVIASDVGGLPSLIEPGRNGLLLPLSAHGVAYAAAIAELWKDPPRYTAMVAAAREAYDTKLNWRTWAESIARELQAVVAERRAATRQVG